MNTSQRVRRATSAAILGAVALSGVGIGTATASSDIPPVNPSNTSKISVSLLGSTLGGLNTSQWQVIAANARAAGDAVAAQAAAQAAAQTAVRPGGTVQPQAIGFLAKKAIKAALKYGKNALPKKIRPYADKLYNLIDNIENTGELRIATMLFNAGLPMDVARYTAKWIVTFL